MIEKLISYAHGREVTVADRPYVNHVFDSISKRNSHYVPQYMPSWITQRLGRGERIMRLIKPRQSVCNPFLLLLVSLQLSILSATGLQSAEVSLPKPQSLFETYCLECHDSQTREGSVDLETLPLQITNLEHAESWQKVLNVLNSGEMPPEDSTQPGNVEKTDLLEALAKTMVNARKRLSDAGGKSRCVGSTDVNTGTALSS